MTAIRTTYLICNECGGLVDVDADTEKEAVLGSGWQKVATGVHRCVSCQSPAYRAIRARRDERRRLEREWTQSHPGDPWEGIPIAFRGVRPRSWNASR